MLISAMLIQSVSTLEKRFEPKTVQLGLWTVSYDLGSLAALLPVTYFGGRGQQQLLKAVEYSAPHTQLELELAQTFLCAQNI